MKRLNKNSNIEKLCPLCHGTGIAEYFDMNDMPQVGAGKYTLGYLCENFGHKCPCPDCRQTEHIEYNNNLKLQNNLISSN